MLLGRCWEKFVVSKPGTFNETSRKFPAMFVFSNLDISKGVCSDKTGYFKQDLRTYLLVFVGDGNQIFLMS